MKCKAKGHYKIASLFFLIFNVLGLFKFYLISSFCNSFNKRVYEMIINARCLVIIENN